MEKEKERLQRIREWAVMQGQQYTTHSGGDIGNLMTLAILFEDYITNGGEGELVKEALKQNE